jgi:hypothetical protein
MTNWYQQGDVMIKPVDKVPEGGTRVSGAVLAEGEATGHRHAAVGEGVAILEHNGVRYLDAPSGATIIHDEHKEIAIPPGQYQIGIVREYDHFEKATAKKPSVRRVRD